MLSTWTLLSAVLLLASVAVHSSTFVGSRLMQTTPSVMWIHLLVFPTFFAAILYANRIDGPKDEMQEKLLAQAPRWLKVMTVTLLAYALVNFVTFIALAEGGVSENHGNSYFVSSHGKVVRELTEDEYHQHQAYELRGFSGVWMAFSSAALLLLTGTAEIRKNLEHVKDGTNKSTTSELTTVGRSST